MQQQGDLENLPNDLFDISPSGSAILNAIRRSQPISRAQLTTVTDLPQQTIHRLTGDLVGNGLLELLPPVIEGRGKPSPRLAIRPAGAYGLGLAIDTDICRLSVTDLDGQEHIRVSIDADPNDPESVVRDAKKKAGEAIASLGISYAHIAGIGISMQGFRTSRGTAFRTPVPLRQWEGIEIADLPSIVDGLPMYAENNATLGAIAELWAGRARSHPNFAYLSFNLGFGAGVVIAGRPYLGASLNAGEISSMLTQDEIRVRPALVSLLDDLANDGIEIDSVSALRNHYDPRWPALDRWIETVTPVLLRSLRAISALLDPEIIVFGGEAPIDLRRRLVSTATKTLALDQNQPRPPFPRLVVGENESDPSLIGASLLPILTRLFRW